MPLVLLRQLTLASLMTLGLTACGGSSGGGPEPGSSSSQSSNSSSSSSVSQTSSSSSESSVSSSSSSSSSSLSSSSSSSQPADLEPAPFSFEPQVDVEPGATLTSNTVTVSGIDSATAISVTGGQYSIDGGAYTDADGEVDLDDEVRVQVTASGSFSTEASATLTIGGISSTFTVTTEAEDTTPDDFGFAPQEGLDPETEVTSEEVEISGINTPVAVNITGGEYRVNGGDFTAEVGELQSGDTISLRAVTLSGPDQTREVAITIGTETVEWALTTAPDEQPPVGEIAFPPPMSASGAETLTIRGRASDALSGVAEVTLTVHHADDSVVPYTLEADEENGFSEWQQTVSLAPGDNRIALQVKDASGNELAEAVEVTVVGQDYEKPFPDDDVKGFDVYNLVFDEPKNRLLLLTRERTATAPAKRVVISVDLETGERTPFVTLGGENEALGSFYLSVGDIDYSRNRLIAAQDFINLIYEFDLDTGLGSVLVDGSLGEGVAQFDHLDHFALSKLDSDYLYMAVEDVDSNRHLIKRNLVTDETTVVSSEALGVGEGETASGVRQIVLSDDEEMAYMRSNVSLFSYNLTTGDREEVPLNYETDGPVKAIRDMVLMEPNKFLISELFKGLMRVDTTSGIWEVVRQYDPNDFLEAGLSHGVHYLERDRYFFMARRDKNAVYAYDVELNQAVVITRYSE